VIEERLKPAIRRGVLDFPAFVGQTLKTGSRTAKSLRHLRDDGAEGVQDVESKSHGFESGVVTGCAQKGHESYDPRKQLVNGLSHVFARCEFSENGLAIADGLDVWRRGNQDPPKEPCMRSVRLIPQLDG
jgi:hypothetical protein